MVEEADFQLLAGLGEAEHDVARVAAIVADGSAGDFPFDHEGANVIFRRVGMERDFGAVENAQQSVLEAQQAL